jgi:hypothetical protein
MSYMLYKELNPQLVVFSNKGQTTRRGHSHWNTYNQPFSRPKPKPKAQAYLTCNATKTEMHPIWFYS